MTTRLVLDSHISRVTNPLHNPQLSCQRQPQKGEAFRQYIYMNAAAMNNPTPQRMPLLEIACFNSDAAFLAVAAGADRIEYVFFLWHLHASLGTVGDVHSN
jgi:hypothetical protein